MSVLARKRKGLMMTQVIRVKDTDVITNMTLGNERTKKIFNLSVLDWLE